MELFVPPEAPPQLNLSLSSKGFGETENHVGAVQWLYIDIVPRLTSVDETVPLSSPDTATQPKEADKLIFFSAPLVCSIEKIAEHRVAVLDFLVLISKLSYLPTSFPLQ